MGAATQLESTATGLLGRNIVGGSAAVSPGASQFEQAHRATAQLPGGKRLPHPVVLKMLKHHRRLKGPKVAKRCLISVASILPYRPRSNSETDRRQLQQAKLQAELALQRGTPLCLENVDRLFPDMRDVVLGNRVFRLIELTDAIHPGKVTGMILQGCSTHEIFDLLHNDKESEAAEAILALVDEAHEVLKCAAERAGDDAASIKAGEESSEEACSEESLSDTTASAAEETPPPTPTERVAAERDEWQVVANPKRRRSPRGR